tara:strand:- start:1283 stop:1837 length:555 start_codon:yes stop_codon:yes gene_type:complete
MAGFNLDLGQSSSDHNGQLESYSVAVGHATLLAPGDVVVLTGTSSVEGIASVDAAAQGAAMSGVIAGIEPLFTGENLTQTGLPASTAGTVRCHIDPNLNFIVECSAALSAVDVGLNADAAVTAASASGGLTVSNMKLDSATKAGTATLQFRIVGLVPNSAGVVDGLTARVRINNSTIRAGAAGV